jgi:hypothetical protein
MRANLVLYKGRKITAIYDQSGRRPAAKLAGGPKFAAVKGEKKRGVRIPALADSAGMTDGCDEVAAKDCETMTSYIR